MHNIAAALRNRKFPAGKPAEITSQQYKSVRTIRGALGFLWLGASALYAQTDPWSTAAARLATDFTGPIARGFALVAIVVGGLQLAFSEGGGRRAMGGLIFGLGLALGATTFMTWLFS